MITMILFQHGAELFNTLALSLVLSQLANVDFSNVALNCRRYESLAGFVGLPGLRHRSAHCHHSGEAMANTTTLFSIVPPRVPFPESLSMKENGRRLIF